MNTVQLQPASEEQIAEFKTAAAAAYKAMNIPADTADYLFTRYMDKVAKQMGLVDQPAPEPVKAVAVPAPVKVAAAPHPVTPAAPAPKIMKLAEQLKTIINAK